MLGTEFIWVLVMLAHQRHLEVKGRDPSVWPRHKYIGLEVQPMVRGDVKAGLLETSCGRIDFWLQDVRILGSDSIDLLAAGSISAHPRAVA